MDINGIIPQMEKLEIRLKFCKKAKFRIEFYVEEDEGGDVTFLLEMCKHSRKGMGFFLLLFYLPSEQWKSFYRKDRRVILDCMKDTEDYRRLV